MRIPDKTSYTVGDLAAACGCKGGNYKLEDCPIIDALFEDADIYS